MPISRRTSVRVVINDEAISSHFSVGGSAYDDGVKVGRRAHSIARSYAGSRTGELKRLITVGYGKRGPYLFAVNLVSNASYSKYVNDGTTGPILPRQPMLRDDKTGRVIIGGLSLPPWGAHGHKVVPSVKGQYPKRFLERGMAAGLKSQGYPGTQLVFN